MVPVPSKKQPGTVYTASIDNAVMNRTIASVGHNSLLPLPTTKTLKIKTVVFNGPATIVFWADKTKTVVKCENEDFDREKGLAMAIAKKALGNKGNYYNTFKKWVDQEWTNESGSSELALAENACS